eukprot:4298947-Prymnesium_polylepis.1
MCGRRRSSIGNSADAQPYVPGAFQPTAFGLCVCAVAKCAWAAWVGGWVGTVQQRSRRVRARGRQQVCAHLPAYHPEELHGHLVGEEGREKREMLSAHTEAL